MEKSCLEFIHFASLSKKRLLNLGTQVFFIEKESDFVGSYKAIRIYIDNLTIK